MGIVLGYNSIFVSSHVFISSFVVIILYYTSHDMMCGILSGLKTILGYHLTVTSVLVPLKKI